MQYIKDLNLSNFFDLSAFPQLSLFEDCAFPWQAIERLSAYLAMQDLGKIETDVPPSAFLVDPSMISIGPGTFIEPGAYIEGPCIIGAHCTIRHGAYIRGGCILGDHCVVGHSTEIKHSILLNHACAAHFNYVGDSILGNRVNLGAGVKCANYRFDHQPVTVTTEEGVKETGLRKLGAVIGDDAQVGCNCVINPGTLVGKMSFCYPCLNIYGRIPDHAKVKPVQKNIVECKK